MRNDTWRGPQKIDTAFALVAARKFRDNYYLDLINQVSTDPLGAGTPLTVLLNNASDVNVPLPPSSRPVMVWQIGGYSGPTGTTDPDTINPCAGTGATTLTDPIHTLIVNTQTANCNSKLGFLTDDVIELGLIETATINVSQDCNYGCNLSCNSCRGGDRHDRHDRRDDRRGDCGCNNNYNQGYGCGCDCECGCDCPRVINHYVVIKAPCKVCDRSKRVIIRNFRSDDNTVRVFLQNGCEPMNKCRFYDVPAHEWRYLIVENGRLIKLDN